MNNLKEVLQKLDDADLHVHHINHSDGYHGFKQPIAHLVNSTHFIMHGSDVIHVGNLTTIESFALALEQPITPDKLVN